MDQPLTSEQIKELLKLDYEKREKSKGYGTAITGLVGVGSGAASHHILRKDNAFFRNLPKVGIAGGLILTGMGLGRVNRIKDKEKAREARAVTMSARDEFQKIVFGHMEDEEPTDRTKRAREVPENRVGKEVPPKRMRKLFADLKEAVRKSGKVKLSAREQLNIIRFGGEQIAKLVSSIERRATLNPKMAGPADKFLRDVAQNPMYLPTKRIYSNTTPQDTASAIDRIAGSKKPSSEYTDQPYHRRALARAVKDWRGGGYENPALMKKWDWETKPPGARFSAREELDTILFSIFSTSTAKKVFRGLAGGLERAPLIRPSGPTAIGAYLPKNVTGEQASAVGDHIGGMIGSKVTMKPHSILLPRQNRFDLENSPIGKSGKELPNIGGPVEVAAHERGHAYDPNLPERMERMQKTRKGFRDALDRGDQAAAVSAGRSMGARAMQDEYVANKLVLDQVAQHGTAGEVSAWKKYANNQMKVGYRKPMFDAAIEKKNAPQWREIGETGETYYLSPATNPTISQGKQILRDNPYLRRSATALASRSGSLFLNAKGSSRAELDLILFANDPRPRDSQGQFTDANGNMIDPNSIAVAYNKPPQAQPPQQEKPEEEEQDKPKEEESKAKKLISKLNKKESNKKESDMKQNNMSAREELEGIIEFGSGGMKSLWNKFKAARADLTVSSASPDFWTKAKELEALDKRMMWKFKKGASGRKANADNFVPPYPLLLPLPGR